MSNLPIDFVIPWVNPNDPDWQENFVKYQKAAGIYTDSSINRYRDWDILKYWFRGVEQYAPWVNKIHFITCGHYPEWLNLNHPKVNFVKHEDYIPKEYLPTFSANPIEIHLHRIKDLSEHFVYFNDDIFIKAPLTPKHFFKNKLPCDSAILTAYSGSGFSRLVINSCGVVNKHNNKVETILQSPTKWFNAKYGYQLFRTLLLLPWKEFTGFYDYHLANAYLKSTFREVWSEETDLLNMTSASKFRHSLDLNQAVFRNWQLVNNNFTPISKHKLGDYLSITSSPTKTIIKSLKSNKKPLLCLNDDGSESLVDIEQRKKAILKAFEAKFPHKSAFEL